MNSMEIVQYVRQFFPITTTKEIAKHTGLSEYQVRTIAKKHHVKKCEEYMKRLKADLVIHRRNWYEKNIPSCKPTHYQEQLLYGSILGDGYISPGAARSIHHHYQEHFGESQRGYREWKQSHLEGLPFMINGNYLQSASHPYFTALRSRLYPNGSKTLTNSFLSACVHPIFLTALYLDDGSLVMSYRYNQNKQTVYCCPSVILYTLNFTPAENRLLADHLNDTFGTNFVVSRHPDGHKSLLKLNKEHEVRHLLNVIAPYAKGIPSVEYKTDIELNVSLKTQDIYQKYGNYVKIVISSSGRMKAYTSQEIDTIIKLKHKHITDQAIADELGRSYWSIVYKINELRKKGFFVEM